jgi:hypothetical protein
LSTFRITVARIERVADNRSGQQVCVTFDVARRAISFHVPILLNVSDYDDTEMVQVGRAHIESVYQCDAVRDCAGVDGRP